MLNHMMRMHIPDGCKYRCKRCKRNLPNKTSFRNHRCKGRTIPCPSTSSQRDRIPCDTCGKIVSRDAMKTHQLAFHSSGTTHLCRACYKCFSNANDLALHQKQCKKKLYREKESPCDVCGKVLATPRCMQTLFTKEF